nr:hypothetical protein [uncultured Agathobaculum sp.]
MKNKIDYKNILVNYGSMVAEAPTKKQGLALVKKDWEAKKQQMEVSIDTALVDVGIRMMTVSKKRFDMKKYLETGEFPSYHGCYADGLDEVISLFKILKVFKEDSSVKECLDHIMSLWAENLDTMTIFDREDFFDRVVDMMGYPIETLMFWDLQKIFDYDLDTIFGAEIADLLDFNFNLSEEELMIFEDFSNHFDISIIMKYMYSDLYDRIIKSVFGNSVEWF